MTNKYKTIQLKGFNIGLYCLTHFKYTKEKAIKTLIDNNQIKEKNFNKALKEFNNYLNKIGYNEKDNKNYQDYINIG